ncbi:MAG TPA: carboxymuconolactone decarboxylase family protein [Acidimicrobiales bacterium]|nr:carboxymuconolactone decarboxylase family protein [Acidimicrobiales bacterium]
MPSDAQAGPTGGARPATPRIPPLAEADRDDQARALLAEAGGPAAGATNIFATFVRHPGLFRRWLPFGGKLLAGKIPPRDRELVILRTGWNCRSDYEWAQHVRIARAAGLADDEIARVREGPDAPGWAPLEVLLLRAADELHADACIGDGTWAGLTAHYDEKQMIELPMLVGHYHLVAFTLSSLGVQVEDEVAAAAVLAGDGPS